MSENKMREIKMIIHKIKGIEHGVIDIPLENGIYAIVGGNGTGKSTIMSCMAQLLSRHNLGLLMTEDYKEESYVEFIFNDLKDHWYCKDDFWQTDSHPKTIRFNGTYEGSLFYGARFKDSKNVDELMYRGEIKEEDISNDDGYITEHLGEILHNQSDFYKGLKRIRNRETAERLSLKNTPYFQAVNDNLISQYRMSSGECLLISLLHFIYNSLIRRSLPVNKPILMLIDEIELALHPVAIINLLDLLQALTSQYDNLTVILTTHSPEVIRKILPTHIFKIERSGIAENSLNIINPCYPSYAIRDIYTHDGFDYLLLVEDELAKTIVKKAIDTLGLENSRLINVLPVGGWENVLKLQYELFDHNILGVGKKVFSILDADIQKYVGKQYNSLKKLFLPISSVEKFLLKVLVTNAKQSIKKKINDKFFNLQSVDNIISQYNKDQRETERCLGDKFKPDNDGKRLYQTLIKNLKKRRIPEESFVQGLYEIIQSEIDLSAFHSRLKNELHS